MSDRDELARDIFSADNWRLTEEAAHTQWAEWIKGGTDPKQNYAFDIADGLIAKGYRKLVLDDATVERAARALENPAWWDMADSEFSPDEFQTVLIEKNRARSIARRLLAAAVEVQGG